MTVGELSEVLRPETEEQHEIIRLAAQIGISVTRYCWYFDPHHPDFDGHLSIASPGVGFALSTRGRAGAFFDLKRQVIKNEGLARDLRELRKTLQLEQATHEISKELAR